MVILRKDLEHHVSHSLNSFKGGDNRNGDYIGFRV